jgi:DNA polymerase-3 subunit beta
LNEAVARAGLIHRTQNQAEASIRLRVEPDEGQIYLLTQSPETGRYEDVLTAQITGKPLEIMFSIRPFEELLRAFPLDMVRVKFGSSLSPCICTPAEPQNGGDYLSLIMPLRITG